MNKLGLFALFALLMSALVMAGTTWSSASITHARTPWGSINSGTSIGSSSNSSVLRSSATGMRYLGMTCKANKNGKSMGFRGKMSCQVLTKDLFGNEWSCASDVKTIQCNGPKCPYSQCGIIGK